MRKYNNINLGVRVLEQILLETRNSILDTRLIRISKLEYRSSNIASNPDSYDDFVINDRSRNGVK